MHLCQNFGISGGGGGLNTPNPPPRYATEENCIQKCLCVGHIKIGLGELDFCDVAGSELVEVTQGVRYSGKTGYKQC